MIRESETLLPNLKRVYIENIHERPVDDLVEALRERGIAYDGSGNVISESKYTAKLLTLLSGQGED
jgi:hypothetical protein